MLEEKTKTNLVSSMVVALAFFLLPIKSNAVPAAPVIHTLSQSDGSIFEARQWGDEFCHGWETQDGYTIVFDQELRNWTYAIPHRDGRLISSSRIVLREEPRDIPKFLRPAAKTLEMGLLMRLSKESTIESSQESTSPAGTSNIPIILINFSDTTPTYTKESFQTLLFGTGNYSMKDYYEEVSYGKFSVSSGPAGIAGWYNAKNTHDYYGRNDTKGDDLWPGTLVREAVAATNAAGFDWTPYDQDGDCYIDIVAIVHQGSDEADSGKATDIWSHQWDLNSAYKYGFSDGGEYTTNTLCPKGGYLKINNYIILPETNYKGGISTIGVFAHEYGHVLGLPDLYDTDYSSNGVGSWSLMASGNWNYVTNFGDRPGHLDAWSKYKLGWVTPTKVTGTLTKEPITQAALYPDVYQLLDGSPWSGGEYFLVENRQKVGFDQGLPGAGFLIWHVDESKENNNEECYPRGPSGPSWRPSCAKRHYKVALVQADNQWHLEKGRNLGDGGDPFYGPRKKSFTASSSPNSNLYKGSPSNVAITDISASGETMTATLTAP